MQVQRRRTLEFLRRTNSKDIIYVVLRTVVDPGRANLTAYITVIRDQHLPVSQFQPLIGTRTVGKAKAIETLPQKPERSTGTAPFQQLVESTAKGGVSGFNHSRTLTTQQFLFAQFIAFAAKLTIAVRYVGQHRPDVAVGNFLALIPMSAVLWCGARLLRRVWALSGGAIHVDNGQCRDDCGDVGLLKDVTRNNRTATRVR